MIRESEDLPLTLAVRRRQILKRLSLGDFFVMKAAVLKKPKILEIKEVTVPDCPEDGVRIKVMTCGICSSDAKMVTVGHRALIYPRILGHEISGIVDQSRTKRFKEGDRVQVAPGLRCATCFQCRKGSDNQCENREIFGFTRDGGFAEYMTVPVTGPIVGSLSHLPKSMSFAAATLAEPLACCINAQEKIRIKSKDSVLITGGGPLGLLHAFLARHNGAAKVFISEIQPHRRKIANRLWTDKVFDPSHGKLQESVMKATDQKGVDAIIFACSSLGLDENFLKMLAPGGRISCFSGTPSNFSRFQWDVNLFHYYEYTISGAYGCTAENNHKALELISTEKQLEESLITNRVKLDNLDKGIKYVKSNISIKTIVEA